MMIANKVVADNRRKEIRRDKLRSLMKQLKKGMLAIRSRFTPNHRSGRILHDCALAGHTLPIALHVSLLQVRRKPVKVLVVGEDGMARDAKEIDVPDPDQCEKYRAFFSIGLVRKMLIHRMCAGKEFFKSVHADCERDGKPYSRPERVSPAHPIPKCKHVFRIDAKLFYFPRIRREGNKMAGNTGFCPPFGQEPLFCREGVGESLLRGKRFGRYNKECRLGIQFLESLDHMCAINVRHKCTRSDGDA